MGYVLAITKKKILICVLIITKKITHFRFDHYKKKLIHVLVITSKTHLCLGHYKKKLICVLVIEKKKKTHLRFGHNKKKKLICVLVLTKKRNSFTGESFQFLAITTIITYFNFLWFRLCNFKWHHSYHSFATRNVLSS